jgi:hypothetical protein
MKFYSCFPTRTVLGVTLVFGLMFFCWPTMAQPTVTASGTGGNTQTATENSWVAAHFACNRSGFWADLDTLTVTGTDKSSYTIAGGRKKINTYRVNVSATCGTQYQRYPSDQQPED